MIMDSSVNSLPWAGFAGFGVYPTILEVLPMAEGLDLLSRACRQCGTGEGPRPGAGHGSQADLLAQGMVKFWRVKHREMNKYLVLIF